MRDKKKTGSKKTLQLKKLDACSLQFVSGGRCATAKA
jgi:hypothetical protein